MDDSVEAEQIRSQEEVPSESASTDASEPQSIGAAVSENGDGELREQVLDALRHVHDPELGINIVDLGLVYGVDIDGDTVHITYTLTTMGCPIGPMIEAEIKQFLSGVEGVENVDAEMVLRPPWTPEMMSDEAKAALGFF
jgi:metal-sulfur cluster biosynthetic enzyme